MDCPRAPCHPEVSCRAGAGDEHPLPQRRSAGRCRFWRLCRDRHRDLGVSSASGPALRRPIVARRRVRRCRSNRPRPDAGEKHRAAPADPKITKLFHFARFDVAVLFKTFGVMAAPIHCTKIASKLARTYTDRHGLKDLARELLGVELSNSSNPPIGATRRSRRRSFPMRRPTSSICMPCASASTRCSSARTASRSPPPVSSLCRHGRVST